MVLALVLASIPLQAGFKPVHHKAEDFFGTWEHKASNSTILIRKNGADIDCSLVLKPKNGKLPVIERNVNLSFRDNSLEGEESNDLDPLLSLTPSSIQNAKDRARLEKSQSDIKNRAKLLHKLTLDGDRLDLDILHTPIHYDLDGDTAGKYGIFYFSDKFTPMDHFFAGYMDPYYNGALSFRPKWMSVRRIPELMRSRKLPLASQLLEAWFQKPSAVKSDASGNKIDWSLDLKRISFNWIRSQDSPKVEDALRKLQDPKRIGKIVKSEVAPNVREYMRRVKGASTPGMTLDILRSEEPRPNEMQEYHKRRQVDYEFIDSYFDGTEIPFALGRFHVYASYVGWCQVKQNDLEVHVAGLDVYVLDSFDFNGSQELGLWLESPPYVIVQKGDSIPAVVASLSKDRWFRATNSSFREWRERFGVGRDFNIATDVSYIRLKQPVVVSVDK